MKEKFISKEDDMKIVKNNNLICKDCKYRYDDSAMLGNVSKCERFDDKPFDVLAGGVCSLYEKE